MQEFVLLDFVLAVVFALCSHLSLPAVVGVADFVPPVVVLVVALLFFA